MKTASAELHWLFSLRHPLLLCSLNG